jgi:hypothetical protein
MEKRTSKKEEFESYFLDDHDPEKIVFPVQCWKGEESLESEGIAFLEKGHVDCVRELAEAFITHGRDPKRRRTEYESREEAQKRTVLEFIFKPSFEKVPLEKQKQLFREACEKRGKYQELQAQARREFHSAKDREARLRVARKYDEQITELGLEVFYETGKTFLELTQIKIGEKSRHPHSQRIRPKTAQERRIAKAMSAHLSPFSYNYLKLKDGRGRIMFTRKEQGERGQREVTFEIKRLSDKNEIVLDFLFDKHGKRNGAELLKSEPRPADIITLIKFEEVIKKTEEDGTVVHGIPFTSAEFRKRLGVRITDQELAEALHELRNTEVKLEGAKIWYEKGEERKHYKKVTFESSIIQDVVTEETGKLAPKGNVQHKFIVTFSTAWNMIFTNDILNRRYACFPKKFYDDISIGARALGRYLACWRSCFLTIGRASEILGYGCTINLRKRKKHIEAKFNELKRIGTIKSWERAKKDGRELVGEDTVYKIVRG